MQTIVLEQPGKLVLTDTHPPATAGPGEALVRVRRIGICGTDLHAYRGRQPFFSYPRILGHELGVEIVAVADDVPGLAPGDRCAVEPYLHCGSCIACRRGRSNCCARLQVLGVHTDGGMREWITVPANKLHRSDQLSLEQLALVETLGIGCHAVQRSGIRADETCLILGAGPIGLAVLEFVKIVGANVAVMDYNEARLAFCRQRMGVQYTLLPGEDVPGSLRQVFAGDLPEVVFDATGSSESMSAAFGLVAPSGRLVFVGLTIDEVCFRHPVFHRVEGTLLCSRNALPGEFTRIIRLIEEGRLDTRPWITHRAPFAELPVVFPGYLQPGTNLIKAIVEVGN